MEGNNYNCAYDNLPVKKSSNRLTEKHQHYYRTYSFKQFTTCIYNVINYLLLQSCQAACIEGHWPAQRQQYSHLYQNKTNCCRRKIYTGEPMSRDQRSKQ